MNTSVPKPRSGTGIESKGSARGHPALTPGTRRSVGIQLMTLLALKARLYADTPLAVLFGASKTYEHTS